MMMLMMMMMMLLMLLALDETATLQETKSVDTDKTELSFTLPSVKLISFDSVETMNSMWQLKANRERAHSNESLKKNLGAGGKHRCLHEITAQHWSAESNGDMSNEDMVRHGIAKETELKHTKTRARHT